MTLLPLWNNSFALTLLVITGVLAVACLAASRLRLSAAARNSILAPALILTCAAPIALFAARGASWTIPLPLLHTDSAAVLPLTKTPTSPSLSEPAPIAAPRETAHARSGAREIGHPSDQRSISSVLAGGLLAAWATGSVFGLVRLGRSYLSLWRLLANARPVDDDRIVAAAAEAASAIGLAASPTILVSEKVSSPVAVGTPRHGWVIWPSETLDDLPDDQLLHVLMHEGAHIAHRDSALRLVQGLIAAALWWHPLVHIVNRQLSRTREELCDNAVLWSADPVQYSQTLLDFGRRPMTQRSPALAVALFPEHERLEHRIQNLLHPGRITMDRSRPSVLLAVCLAGVAASALAGATRVTAADFGSSASPDARWLTHNDRELTQEYSLSFDDPSRPGHLDIDIKRGDILVTAYGGDDVLVRLSVPEGQPTDTTRAGEEFQAVAGRPLDFTVRQNGNTIELDGNAYDQITHVEVLVPRRIDLTLDSYRSGVIRVTGVDGHVAARSQNNDIFLVGITGTADIYGYNGNFTASFHEVTGELAFETYNGSIDLVLPADLQATTYVRAESEDVQSQFPIIERPAEPAVIEHDDGSSSIQYGDSVVGDINGGGSRIVIETTNGSVLLRTP